MFIYNKINILVDEMQAEKKYLTVQKIADIIGISKTMFDQVRNGKSKPTVEVMEKIAIGLKKDMNYFFDQPGWNSYDMKIEEVEKVNEQPELYHQTSSLRNPWELLYETQRELMDVKVENERLKKISVRGKNASAG